MTDKQDTKTEYTKKKTSLYLEPEDIQELKIISAKKGIRVNKMLEELIKDFIENNK